MLIACKCAMGGLIACNTAARYAATNAAIRADHSMNVPHISCYVAGNVLRGNHLVCRDFCLVAGYLDDLPAIGGRMMG